MLDGLEALDPSFCWDDEQNQSFPRRGLARDFTSADSRVATLFPMKKNDPRWNDTRRIEGSGNVFVDLGFDPVEAEAMFRESACLMSETGSPARFRLAESGQARTRLRRIKRGRV